MTPEVELLVRRCLHTVPGYRERARQHVAKVARAAESRARRLDLTLGDNRRSRPIAVETQLAPVDERRRVQRGLRELLNEIHEDET